MEKSGFQKNSEKFLIRTSRIESSRFRARVAKRSPAFRDRITRRSQESKIVYRGVGADFEIALPGEAKSPKLCIEGWVQTLKSKKIFSANNEQGSIKRG